MIGSQYKDQDHLLVALDCIIFGFDRSELKLLLIKRDFEPEKGKWSLMGGFLTQHESLDESAERILHKLTGLENIYLEQLQAFREVDRDPVERTISVAYYALIDILSHSEEIAEDYSASWFSIHELPELIFDHRQMVDAALKRLRHKASTHPVGFELLPEKFTLPELQKLYEAIYDTQIDKRNFRRRMLGTDVLRKTNQKQKKFSKKGAWLYEFDSEKYFEKMEQGDNLVFKPLN